MKILMVGAFGFLGVLARYGIYECMQRWQWTHFVPTLTVNLLGAAAIGFINALPKGMIVEDWRAALTVGFLGGFTTFSALSFDAFLGLQAKQWGQTLLYLSASIFLGVLCCYLGARLATHLWSSSL